MKRSPAMKELLPEWAAGLALVGLQRHTTRRRAPGIFKSAVVSWLRFPGLARGGECEAKECPELQLPGSHRAALAAGIQDAPGRPRAGRDHRHPAAAFRCLGPTDARSLPLPVDSLSAATLVDLPLNRTIAPRPARVLAFYRLVEKPSSAVLDVSGRRPRRWALGYNVFGVLAKNRDARWPRAEVARCAATSHGG